MNKKYLVIGIVAILIIGFYLYSSNLKSEWAINMPSFPNSIGAANCIENLNGSNPSPYAPYSSQEEYFAVADYVLTVEVSSLKETEIDDDTGKRELSFEILNWEKGKLDFVPKKLKISTDYNPALNGVEGDTPFGHFKEGESYKIYLEDEDGRISFLGDENIACNFNGIIKI